VAEACSGVKFLIAMVAFGVLAANVCFRSWWRRFVLLVVCVVVPVLANGVRAWGTVYVAQSKGAAYASGFDHIVYGWFFFAAVIAAIIALSWPFFDRGINDPMIDGAAIAANPRLARLDAVPMGSIGAVVGAGVILAVSLVWTTMAQSLVAPMPRLIAPPQIAGWHRVPTPFMLEWTPRVTGADHHIQLRYGDDQGHIVDMVYALYSAQGPGKKASGYGEGLCPWARRGNGRAPAPRPMSRAASVCWPMAGSRVWPRRPGARGIRPRDRRWRCVWPI
jgi:exosortase/archaeosortase family protein